MRATWKPFWLQTAADTLTWKLTGLIFPTPWDSRKNKKKAKNERLSMWRWEVKLQFWLKYPPLGEFGFWWLLSLGSAEASGSGATCNRSVMRLPLFTSFWKLLCSILTDGSDICMKLLQTRAECIIKYKMWEDFLIKEEFLLVLFMLVLFYLLWFIWCLQELVE